MRVIPLVICLFSLVVLGKSSRSQGVGEAELRGVWMHATAAKNKFEADKMLDKIEKANLNAIYLLVFYWNGHAYYRSKLIARAPEMEKGFDTLAYMVREAHKRGMELHAWFVNGPVGSGDNPGTILSKHPEWGIMNRNGARDAYWLDFNQPEVRKFMSDVMLEVLKNYEVDGVHFDYIRYPGKNWCYCDYCKKAFKERYGLELVSARVDTLPAFAYFSANPVVGVKTAQVLAEFENKVPAIILNQYGKGKALIFNWHAEDKGIGAVDVILKRAIKQFAGEKGRIYILRSETNAQKYGFVSFDEVIDWLRTLDIRPETIQETALGTIQRDSVLILPCIYLMTEQTAEQLGKFVESGGNVIFIDGPVFAMNYEIIQKLTGMEKPGEYFSGERLILPVGEHPLIPIAPAEIDLEKERERAAKWDEFRKEGVSLLVKDVYERAKKLRPKAWVTAAVFYNKKSAEMVLQDWYRWLKEGYIDYALPMAYLTDNAKLEEALSEWKDTAGSLERIFPGLGIFLMRKEPQKVISQIELCRDKGAKGIVLFSVHQLEDDLAAALTAGPFKEKVAPYHPSQKAK